MGLHCGIGFSSNGKWAVADCDNHCVCLYDGDDRLVRKIDKGELYPKGVTFDNEDICTLLLTTRYRSLLLMVTTCCSLAGMDLMMVN